MAFMVPQYTQQAFITGEDKHGGGFAFPADVCGESVTIGADGGQFEKTATIGADGIAFGGFSAKGPTAKQRRALLARLAKLVQPYVEGEPDPESLRIVQGKFWARLSAPGYLDATDWSGPFDTLKEARADLAKTHEVDPDSGEDLPDGADWPDGSTAPGDE
jgi:hypothetical protein